MSVWKTLNAVICYGYACSLIYGFIGGLYLVELNKGGYHLSWWENQIFRGLSVGCLMYMILYYCIPKRLRVWK